MMTYIKRLSLLILFLSFLIIEGCGQTGDLYLPKPEQTHQSAAV